MLSPVALELVVLLLTAQTADVALVPVSRTNGLSEERTAQLAAELGDLLRAQKLVVTPERPALPQCLRAKEGTASSDVVAYAARVQDATVALRVEGAELGDRAVIALEALDADTGAKLASQTLTTHRAALPSSWQGQLTELFAAIRAETSRRPAKPKLVPVAEPPPPKIVERVVERPPLPREAYLAPAALGVVLLGGGSYALVSSRARYGQLTDPAGPRLSADEARRVAVEGQSLQSLGVAGIVAGVLAVGSGVALWALSAPSGETAPSVAVTAGPGQLSLRGTFF